MHSLVLQNLQSVFLVLLAVCCSLCLSAQNNAERAGKTYPKEIRGYKVEKARVLISRRETKDEDPHDESTDAILQLGDPDLVTVTPFGITFDLPVSLSAVKNGGHVDFLAFEDVVVNGTPVNVDDYLVEFELPVSGPARLPAPIRVTISLPNALLGALDEWSDSKPTWNVTARVYIFGRFKKFLMKFKRVVPVEIQTEISNPLRQPA